MANYQRSLFDIAPIVRKHDPVSSLLAADEMVDSGKLAERERVALGLVNLHPGKTGEELDQLAGAKKREISKRLAGLAQKRQIVRGRKEEMRACSVTGRLCLTWWPMEISSRKESVNANENG
jgi:hypothetical protein